MLLSSGWLLKRGFDLLYLLQNDSVLGIELENVPIRFQGLTKTAQSLQTQTIVEQCVLVVRKCPYDILELTRRFVISASVVVEPP